jgi:NADH-quinone oxidoreductase subunit G
VLSAQHSNEDNLAAVKLASLIGTQWLYLTGLGGWEGDNILRSADNNPNRKGALQAAGRAVPALSALLDAIKSDQVDAVVVLGSAAAEGPKTLAPLREVSTIVLASNEGPLCDVASVVIPVAGHAEHSGTFVNEKGMAQRYQAAVSAPDGVLPAWETLAALARAMGKQPGFDKLADLQAASGGAEARV